MDSFIIKESFDKFEEMRTIKVQPANISKYFHTPTAFFVSSPEGNSIFMNVGRRPNPDVILLDNLTRLRPREYSYFTDGDKAAKADTYIYGSLFFTRADLESICNSSTVEFSRASKNGLSELCLIPLARTLYNVAIEQRYPQKDIDALYDKYKEKLLPLDKQADKQRRWIDFKEDRLPVLIGIVGIIGIIAFIMFAAIAM